MCTLGINNGQLFNLVTHEIHEINSYLCIREGVLVNLSKCEMQRYLAISDLSINI